MLGDQSWTSIHHNSRLATHRDTSQTGISMSASCDLQAVDLGLLDPAEPRQINMIVQGVNSANCHMSPYLPLEETTKSQYK